LSLHRGILLLQIVRLCTGLQSEHLQPRLAKIDGRAMLRWRSLGQGPYEVVGDLGTNPGDTPRVVHIGRAWNQPLFSIEGVYVRLCCDTRLHVGPVMLAIRCVLFLSRPPACLPGLASSNESLRACTPVWSASSSQTQSGASRCTVPGVVPAGHVHVPPHFAAKTVKARGSGASAPVLQACSWSLSPS
jgi:hypothetical protein